jgi:hypothetical protein
LVEPVGYANLWQKFENDVYNIVKKKLQDKSHFQVDWNSEIHGLKPDVTVSIVCDGHNCEQAQDETPNCLFPAFIFDAYCKFEVDKEYFQKKDEQMRKYAKICNAVLVMPQGYEQFPFCKSKDGTYHIVSLPFLYTFVDSIKAEIEINYRDDCCGESPFYSVSNIYKHFELSIRSSVDKCPKCDQKVEPISLLHCSQYDEYNDSDTIEEECNCCDNRKYWSYEDCPFLGIESKFQCRKCGAIFDPESKKIIDNFSDSYYDMFLSEVPYYKKE